MKDPYNTYRLYEQRNNYWKKSKRCGTLSIIDLILKMHNYASPIYRLHIQLRISTQVHNNYLNTLICCKKMNYKLA